VSRRCDICGKGPVSGHSVSHSAIKNPRWFEPNLQRIRRRLPDGRIERVRVCTRCLRTLRRRGEA
jgi:large subunit ribosomal protein L28